MMRRSGLLVGMILGVFLLVGQVAAQKVSVFNRQKPDFDHVYGIQINGGFNMFSMSDINDYRANVLYEENIDDAVYGIGGGMAFLYRASENYRITVGYQLLGQDRTYVEYGGDPEGKFGPPRPHTDQFEQTVSGGELYILGNYIIPWKENMNLAVSLGPTVVSGNMDKSDTDGASFSAAKGRTFGFRAGLGLELMFKPNYGLWGTAGYRYAKIGEITYEDLSNAPRIVYWVEAAQRKMTLDYSGAFVELGLRVYYEPATDWVKF